MIVMLVNQMREHVAALLLVSIAADAAATPRNFLPHQQAEFVAELQHQRRLLVMTKPNKIRTHVFDFLKRLAHDRIGHRSSNARVIFVILCSA